MTRALARRSTSVVGTTGARRGPRRRGLVAALTVVVGSTSSVLAPGLPAAASQVPAALPSANPANFTPNVENGEVDTIWQVGSRVIIGGTFTSISNATQNGGAPFTRNRIAAFNATTGVVDAAFNPNASGNVNVVIPSADPNSVYVAGSFTTIGGVTRSRVARINVADGSVVAGFNAGTINAQVRDLRLVNGLLYIAGDFSTVAGQGTRHFERCEHLPAVAARPVDEQVDRGGLRRPVAGRHAEREPVPSREPGRRRVLGAGVLGIQARG